MKKQLITFSLVCTCFVSVLPAAAAPSQPVPKLDTQAFHVVQDLGAYRIAKYDVLDLAIIGHPDESWMSQINVGPDGYINLPYTGSLQLAGLTLGEATDVLKQKLSEYVVVPELAVIVKQYGPRQVYVMGEVKREGIYTLAADKMNVFAALSSAGGIAPKGRSKHISVVRVVNNEVLAKDIDFDAFVQKHDVSQNVWLQDGDMIYVPRSGKIILSEDVMPILSAMLVWHNATND
jgi:polysaccharide export outer membrane protein